MKIRLWGLDVQSDQLGLLLHIFVDCLAKAFLNIKTKMLKYILSVKQIKWFSRLKLSEHLAQTKWPGLQDNVCERKRENKRERCFFFFFWLCLWYSALQYQKKCHKPEDNASTPDDTCSKEGKCQKVWVFCLQNRKTKKPFIITYSVMWGFFSCFFVFVRFCSNSPNGNRQPTWKNSLPY